MNWQQLYSSATSEERLEITLIMLKYMEARQNKIIFTKGRLLLERRIQTAHFINDRRNRQPYRRLYLNTFLFVIITISVSVWFALIRIPPQYAAPLLLMHLISLTAILLIKPHRLQSSPKSVLFGGGAR